MQDSQPPPPIAPSFKEAFFYWLKLGFISFGGPAGQIAIMHKELVEKRRWISESHFLHALNFCMLLPGPEAQQLATYLGWRLHGARGGIAAGALFVLPAMLLLYGLSWLYLAGSSLPWLQAIFHGLLPAVIAVVFSALLRIGRKALKSASLWALAALSFVAIFGFKISFVYIILAAGLAGWVGNRLAPRQFPAGAGHGAGGHDPESSFLILTPSPDATWTRTFKILAVCLFLWWTPVLLIGNWLGWESTQAQQGIFFSKAAMVTFGGAYAVLPYVAQQAVENYQWLTHAQMMSGLALAETTPGPLIMVLQFVGFVGGWQQPGAITPALSATLSAGLTTWVTFLPCFLFVFLGAPHVETLRSKPRIAAALTAITAGVVGVILNLGVQFAFHALWPARSGAGWGQMDLFVAVTAIAAVVAMEKFKVGLLPVIGGCALLGWLMYLVSP